MHIKVITIQHYNVEDETILDFLEKDNYDASVEDFKDYLLDGDFFERTYPTGEETDDIIIDSSTFYQKINKLNEK